MQRPKIVFIIHGWDGSPEEPMHASMKKELEKKGFRVIAPSMPHPREGIRKSVSWLLKQIESLGPGTISEQMHFIGHSIGCQVILRTLQGPQWHITPTTKFGKVVLIAPWIYLDENTIAEEGQESVDIAKPWTETPIDWEKVRQHTDQFYCIFSDNDPYVPLSNQEIFKKELGARIIVEHNKGHYTETDGIISNKTAVDIISK